MPKQGSNIYRRKDGRWEGRYVKSRSEGKIQYGYVYGATREEAEKKLGVQRSPEITFAALWEEWIHVQAPQLKPSTVARYENEMDVHLKPRFGESAVDGITRNDLKLFGRELLISGGRGGAGLAPASVNGILSLMKNCLKYAQNEKGIPVADIRNISVRQPKRPMRVLTCQEQRRLNAFLCADLTPRNLGILLTLYTGLRIGEICALQWGDLNLDDHTLRVDKTMQRVKRPSDGGRKTQVIITTPKSGCSIRTVPIPKEIWPLLDRREPDAFLLTGTKKHLEPRGLEAYYQKVVRLTGLDGVTYHTLRHTFATRCVELGFDIKSLSEILGHSSVSITLNRYVHPSMETKKKHMNRLTGFLPKH